MASIPDFVYDGVLDADGTIHLDRLPEVPPGPVRVTFLEISASEASGGILVEDPCCGGYIPTIQLPLSGPVERIYPRRVEMRLPNPLVLDEE